MNQFWHEQVSFPVKMRDLVHLGLDAAAVTVSNRLLNHQDLSGRGLGLNLDRHLLALGLFRGLGPVVASCHRGRQISLEQAEESC